MQNAENATTEESKTKSLQRVKVQHGTCKNTQKSATRKKKKIQNGNCAIWIKCNIQKGQHEKVHKKVQHGNGEACKECSMKNLQHNNV